MQPRSKGSDRSNESDPLPPGGSGADDGSEPESPAPPTREELVAELILGCAEADIEVEAVRNRTALQITVDMRGIYDRLRGVDDGAEEKRAHGIRDVNLRAALDRGKGITIRNIVDFLEAERVPVGDWEVENIFNRIDDDRNGHLDYEEFTMLVLPKEMRGLRADGRVRHSQLGRRYTEWAFIELLEAELKAVRRVRAEVHDD